MRFRNLSIMIGAFFFISSLLAIESRMVIVNGGLPFVLDEHGNRKGLGEISGDATLQPNHEPAL